MGVKNCSLFDFLISVKFTGGIDHSKRDRSLAVCIYQALVPTCDIRLAELLSMLGAEFTQLCAKCHLFCLFDDVRR